MDSCYYAQKMKSLDKIKKEESTHKSCTEIKFYN